MKTLLLGSQGQLGRDLLPRLAGEIIPLTRAELDLAKPETIASVLQAHRPDLFINCAAYNFVDKAEADPNDAFRVNAWGVRELAKACRDVGTKLVHFSTDYAFGLDDIRSLPYPETAAPGPVSQYGLSKLTGEYLVRSTCSKHLVIRTCGLYGAWGSGGKGGNFVETMLRIAKQGKPLKVVNDQRCTPTYTVDLAGTTAKLIELGEEGLFHVTNSGDSTWYELAAEIFRQANVQADLQPITSEQFGAPAQRPAYSVLHCERLEQLGIPLRDWREALAAYLKEKGSTVSP